MNNLIAKREKYQETIYEEIDSKLIAFDYDA